MAQLFIGENRNMTKRLILCLFMPVLLACFTAVPCAAAPSLLGEMAAQSGAGWMEQVQGRALLSFGAQQGDVEVSETTTHEVTVRDPHSGLVLKQTQQWLPAPAMCLLNTSVANGNPSIPPVNVVDWAFQFAGAYDGARFQELAHSKDTWYGSTFWTGPDWTRVGRDWQHSGEKTSSVRRFTIPRDGSVSISGSVFKADTNGGDGVRVSIRHNAETVWQKEIEANDAQGFEPALTLDVKAGDRVRFVVHRRNAIACDTTHWDPVITYADGAVFRASDSFSEAPRNGWSYEMEVEAAASLPHLYSFDRHFCLHEQSLCSGKSVVLDSDSSLPLFVLADDKDACGIAGAVINACPWQIEASLSENGLLSLRIPNGTGGELPVVVTGAYKGGWMNGVAQLERLRRSEAASPDLNPFRERIQNAFNEVLGAADSRALPELDLWAAVQWDWHKQDNLDETQGYEAAIAAVTEKTGKLAADLGAACPVPDATQEPNVRYLRAHALRRQIALNNPLMQFGKMVFCKRVPTSYSHLVMQYYGWRARPGGGIFILERPGYSFASHDIFNGALEKGSILEPRLSYDATRMLFSFVDNAGKECDPLQLNNAVDEGFYHVYEANIDGMGLRQITRGPYDDLMPAYLPDGGIVFSSTRREGYARCFGGQFSPRWHVYTLHRMDADGGNLRALSFHDTNEWFPVVSNTGLVLYSRWDYIDRDAVTHQTLWATRPDGANPVSVWGNATEKPHCTFQIQPIPNSSKIVFTAAAHHSIAAGPIVVVDPEKGNNGQEALTRITPGVPFPEAESMDIKEYYESPWPLSEKYFLVGYSPWPLVWEPGANPPHALGIYLIDVFGNRELIYRDPVIGSTNACPLVPRPVPPALSSALPEDAPDQGEVLVADVYQGLAGIDRGTIAEVRVIQIFPKSTPVGGAPPIGLAAEENGRAVLGEVPVEADGFVRITIPARKPILFQLLDKDGLAVQTMRSVTYLQPGEKVSCVGCHENRMNAPVPGVPLAAQRPASEITPKAFENEPFSYMRVVQPVLDEHCIRCHSGPEPKGKKDLTGAPLNGFNRSYWALCGDKDFAGANTNPETAKAALVPRFGMRNQVQVTPPGGLYGALGSRLIAMLRAGHSDVHLDPEELRRLGQWIDCNAIFYGAYQPEEQASQRKGEHLTMPQLQ